jgi:hypothetical protein
MAMTEQEPIEERVLHLEHKVKFLQAELAKKPRGGEALKDDIKRIIRDPVVYFFLTLILDVVALPYTVDDHTLGIIALFLTIMGTISLAIGSILLLARTNKPREAK